MADIISRQERLKISQALFAQVAGMSGPQLSKLVNGHKNPRENTLKRLSASLDIIEQNMNVIVRGVIVIDGEKFKNTLLKAIMPELEDYFDDPHNHAYRIVTAIYEQITKKEE